MNNLKRFQFNQGYAAIAVTFITFTVSLIIVSAFTLFTFREVRINRLFSKSIAVYYSTEGGIEDALYRVITGKQISSSETFPVGKGLVTITVASKGGGRKTVSSEGKMENIGRKLEVYLDVSTVNTNFVYGVQVGDGGLLMQNNSKVNGSVFTNGDIIGNGSPVITGDAFTASTSKIATLTVKGNAYANSIKDSEIEGYASSTVLIENTTVGKDAHAGEIRKSTINRDAYYQIIDAATIVQGQKFPGGLIPANLSKLDMPISDSTLDLWEQEAQNSGVIDGPCPYSPADGSSLGPVKISCDVIIDGTKEVTVTGTIWIVGNLDLKNSAILKLSPLFGENSAAVIVDDPVSRSLKGIVAVQNSAQVLGSGTAGSFIMVVSRNNSMRSGGDVVAIDVKNSSAASIYYAPHGKLTIQNNTQLKEAVAYGIEMSNLAELTYEVGLQSVNFSSGPSGGYDLKYWKEVE